MTAGRPQSPLTVLVLAGQRDGTIDPLAAAAGERLKALAPVDGRPMIAHVLAAVAATPRADKIVVSINEGSGVERVPEVAALMAAMRLVVAKAEGNLADSVLGALKDARFPVLITTADSVLISPQTIAAIDDEARRESADVAVALARRDCVLAAHPDGQRKFYACRDDAYSNCNSYWLGHPGALAPVELFRSGGQFVKHPMRVVGVFGLKGVFDLIRFRFGLGTLEGGFRRLSGRFDLNIRPIILQDGAAAIDVDHERSRKVVEEVLAGRRGSAALAAE